MKLFILVVSVAFLFSGCASQVMKQHIGQDIREAFIEHGKPINEFDLADGKRVFQFNWGESSSGSSLGVKGGCLLSYITKRNNANTAWIVVDYKYPDRLIC